MSQCPSCGGNGWHYGSCPDRPVVTSFARYLRAQKIRADWIGELARAAERDRRFPWAREPLDMDDRVLEWLRAGADPDARHALHAALAEWNEGPYSLAADAARRRLERKDRIRREMSPELERDDAKLKRSAAGRLGWERRRVSKAGSAGTK